MKIWKQNASHEFIQERLYFVTDYYDGELEGYIKINGEIYYFVINPTFDTYDIYKLTYKEKLACVICKFLFEICVGKHYSYPNPTFTEAGRPRLRNFFYKHIAKRI